MSLVRTWAHRMFVQSTAVKIYNYIIIIMKATAGLINYLKTPQPTDQPKSSAHTFGKSEVVGVIVLFIVFQFYHFIVFNSNDFGHGWRVNLLHGWGLQGVPD